MKKLLTPTSSLVLALLVAVFLRTGAPVEGAQTDSLAQGLEARVATLESQLQAERGRHDETRALLEQTLAYLEQNARAAQTLLGVLDVSEKQGFAVGENWHSRQTLLAGFRAYWGDAQAGIPKVPVPPPVKPATPARPARK